MGHKTFPGGVHPLDFKYFSKDEIIERCPLPSRVILPLSQHIGKLPVPIVKVGEIVKTGQLIAQASDGISLNMHATISGKIKSIDTVSHPKWNFIQGIEIEGDGRDTWVELVDEEDFMQLSGEEMRNRIEEAGICGLGGAGFPSGIKLNPPSYNTIDTAIVSGVECEPYLTADCRLMMEKPEEIIWGLKIMMKILGAKNGIIGIESNKPKSIKTLKKLVKKEKNIRVVTLEFKYPQGGEKQLIYATTKRRVLSKSFPSSVGVIVNNVATVVSMYEAVRYKKPLVEKVITISGKIVKRPSNFMARIGTKMSDILAHCEGTTHPIIKAVIGGPMMGYAVNTLDVPLIKTVSGMILFGKSEIKTEEEKPCLRCGRCIDVCPNGLMPNFIASSVKYNDFVGAKKAGVVDCMQCGCCSYVCPAHIKFIQWIDIGKLKVM
ncbi:MAG: electron transport complex subunit RsxC [Candidatus Cloacimonetes bacterium]|nr:electron transport complex subunit RsxC [Candidatus Cloacimonadota bacterium]